MESSINVPDVTRKNEKKKWTENDTLLLIKLYRNKPLLWNSKIPEYNNKKRQRSAIVELSKYFKVTPQEIKRKIKNLHTQILKELKKERESQNPGSGLDKIYISKWFAYESLLFLTNESVPENMSDSEVIVSPDTEDDVPDDQSDMSNDGKCSILRTSTPQKRKLFLSPAAKHSKWGKNYLAANTPMMEEAEKLIRSVQESKNNKEEIVNEHTKFCEHIAIRMKKIKHPEILSELRQSIERSLCMAEMSQYNIDNNLEVNNLIIEESKLLIFKCNSD